MRLKRGQVTVFVIIAIVIVVGVVLFFAFKDSLFKSTGIPANFQPVYNSFLKCVEDKTLVGASVLGSQGGYIYLPDFESGSSFMPFSSQLSFAGTMIPYWYYVSGNNIKKEQVPTRLEMQNQLARFIEEKVSSCQFESFYSQGYSIFMGEPEVKTIIADDKISVDVKMDFGIEGLENNVVVKDHRVQVNSQLGSLYESARKVYQQAQETMFLENYAIDTLRTYAPVDGVELQCEPKVWSAEEIFDNLENAIEANTIALRGSNNQFDLKDKSSKYFIVNLPVKEEVRFINSKNWPRSFEVTPSEGAVLISKPVGNQEGLGILGFCYVPYHFVYSMNYPVLIQIISGDYVDGEIFQFPFAVVIQGNRPREPYLGGIAESQTIPGFCEEKNTPMKINVYGKGFDLVNADISYNCAGTVCRIGETENGVLIEEFPQCANGFLIVRAKGHEDYREVISTTESEEYNIYLTPFYEIEVDLKLDGSSYNKNAIVTFLNKDRGSARTILYPSQRKVNLSMGDYEVQVYVYSNTSIRIAETTQRECTQVPRSGVGGIFGLTEEKCFDIQIPAQIISNSLSGGGKQNYYVVEDELINSRIVEISATSLSAPTTLEQLQMNYALFEDKRLEVVFR